MKTCRACGAGLAPDARLCPACGVKVSDPNAETIRIEIPEEQELLEYVRQVLGREYDVHRELGRGGMAVVYHATELELHRDVALKVLPPEMTLSSAAGERFKREARMAAALDHPNIVPVYRVGQTGGLFYIAQRFVGGRDLDSIIAAQGALPIPVVLSVLRGVAAALAYAHERDIVHRDIKGANILVERDGRMLVSDYGIARRLSDGGLTEAGTVLGTPWFMSPEQCMGRRGGPQSDQYSLGILAFQMLTGALPFQADGLPALLQHHCYTPVPDLRLAREDVPVPLVKLVNRALAKDAGARFATTRDMVAAIEEIPFFQAEQHEAEAAIRRLAVGSGITKIPTRSLPPLPEPGASSVVHVVPLGGARPGRRAALVAGGAILAALAVGGVWVAGRTRGSVPPPSAGRDSAAAVSVVTDTARVHSPAPRRDLSTIAGTGTVRLRTVPPTALIFIDGRQVGEGVLLDYAVAAGTRQLRVTAPGYRTVERAIVVKRGANLWLGQIALRPRQDQP
ncbi:MAG TPA: protein kinase [Gemmatimonadales bacterium]|nr:protein kinase [Gemmatimonadales bacterium]